MNAEQRQIIDHAIESAFTPAVRYSCRMVSSGESRIVSFIVDIDISSKSAPLALRAFRISAASNAALSDALALVAQEASSGARIPLLLAPALSPEKQDTLRNAGQAFIDDAGNAWLIRPGVHIDIRGRKASRAASASPRQENVFSDKATLIIRYLLERGPSGIREISRGVTEQGFSLSPGYVSKMTAALCAQGYAVKQADETIALRRKAELLADWVAYYRKLSQPAPRTLFLPEPDMNELVRRVGDATITCAVLSEHAGASLVSPFASFDSVLLLTNDQTAALAALHDIGAEEVERGANINLAMPRYASSAFYGAHEVKDCRVASDLQLYLDLMRQPRRGLEAAEHLMQARLHVLFADESKDMR